MPARRTESLVSLETFMLLAFHDLVEPADGPQTQAGENSSGDSSDGAPFLLDLAEDVDAEVLDLFLADVNVGHVHNEPPLG